MSIEVEGMRRALQALEVEAHRHPYRYFVALPHQHALHCDACREKLLRTGNQVGKSLAALLEVLWCCLGEHPHRKTAPPPVEWWVICASFSQSIAVQEKLWNLAPKHRIVSRGWQPKDGFGQNGPLVIFDNGSVIRFKTEAQNTKNLATATIHGALFDEPPANERVFTEVQKRVQEQRGTIILAMTPANVDRLDWLQDRADETRPDGSPMLVDHHYRFSADLFIPVDRGHEQTTADGRKVPFYAPRPLLLGDGTPKDQAWVDETTALTLELERDVTLHGEWQTQSFGAIFQSFRQRWAEPKGTLSVRFGVDHGSGRNFSQFALVLLVGGVRGSETVWARAEYASDAATTTADDADGIMAMLEQSGLEWSEIDTAFGDKIHFIGRGGKDRKANPDLMAALERRIGMARRHLKPKIQSAKIGIGQRGRVQADVQWLHRAMADGRFFVHPSCKALIASLEQWGGERRRDDSPRKSKRKLDTSDWKHGVDSLRYALHLELNPVRRSGLAIRVG